MRRKFLCRIWKESAVTPRRRRRTAPSKILDVRVPTEAEYVVGDYFEDFNSLNPVIRAQNEDRCMSAENARKQGLIRDGAPLTAPDGTTMTYCPAPRRNAKVLLAARHSDYQDVPLSSSYSYSYTVVTVSDSGVTDNRLRPQRRRRRRDSRAGGGAHHIGHCRRIGSILQSRRLYSRHG